MYSSNTGSHYSFLCYSAIINILFIVSVVKIYQTISTFHFLHNVLLEIRISTYCMNYIFSGEDLFPYLIKSFPKRLSLSLCHIISLNSELYFPNRFFIDKKLLFMNPLASCIFQMPNDVFHIIFHKQNTLPYSICVILSTAFIGGTNHLQTHVCIQQPSMWTRSGRFNVTLNI